MTLDVHTLPLLTQALLIQDEWKGHQLSVMLPAGILDIVVGPGLLSASGLTFSTGLGDSCHLSLSSSQLPLADNRCLCENATKY